MSRHSCMAIKADKAKKLAIAERIDRDNISAINAGKEARDIFTKGNQILRERYPHVHPQGYHSLGTKSVFEEAVEEEKRKYRAVFKALDVLLAEYE